MIIQGNNYQTGDILLYDQFGDGITRYLFGKVARFFTKGKYIHAAIYLGEHEEMGPIIGESVASGFMIRVYDNLGDVHLRYHKDLSNAQKNMIVNRALQHSGYIYGYLDLFKLLFYLLTNQTLFYHTKNQLTCVEGIARIYKEIGLDIVERDDLDLVLPEDIYYSNKLVTIDGK